MANTLSNLQIYILKSCSSLADNKLYKRVSVGQNEALQVGYA